MPFLRFRRLLASLPLLLTLPGCKLYEPNKYPPLSLPPQSQPIKILFLGNSLTYYNDLPGLLAQMSVTQPRPLQVESLTAPYVSLKFHWNRGTAAQRLRTNHYDYVILQEFSTQPAEDPAATLEDYRRFVPLIQASGAQLIIFENWPRKSRPADAPRLAATYQKIQSTLRGLLAPIGPAWQLSEKQNPQIPLYASGLFEDGRHPSPAGTYLTACILYQVIYHNPAPTQFPHQKLPPTITTPLQNTATQLLSNP